MDVPRLGELSPDAWWAWNGTAWVPAMSADGRWRWDGDRWQPQGAPQAPRVRWTHRWSVRRRVALGLWALVLVGASVGWIYLAVAIPGERGLALVLLAVTPFAWSAVVGGAIVPQVHWKDVPVALSTGVVALLLGLLVTYGVGLSIDDCSSAVTQAQAASCTDDHAASIGMFFAAVGGALLWSLMIPVGLVAAFVRRRLTRRRTHRGAP